MNVYLGRSGTSIPSGATVIDIGSQCRLFYSVCRFTLCRFPGYFSFEPVPVNYAQLETPPISNLNSSRRIKCFPKAVAGQAGEIGLSFDSKRFFYDTSATIF